MSQGHSSYKGNIMTPLNWFTVITETGLLPTAAINWDKSIGPICLYTAIGIMIFYAVVYLFCLLNFPDRLQSEGFNIVVQGLHVETSITAENTKVVGDGSSLSHIDSKTISRVIATDSTDR
ncbi:MAG: hypothetical protein CME71_02090 [Halobacteriovorax sp.]|nr:hypothetical protein [Halobacteriovorax sp.]